MMNGLFLILLAAFFQGTFALFLKFTNPWKWENFWFVYSIVALVISPIAITLFLIPNLTTILLSLPSGVLISSFFFGMLWGVGSVLFGLSVVRIGLALTYSLILGLTIVIGSLLPLFFDLSSVSAKVVLALSFGIVLIFSGLTISTCAGIKRERLQKGKGFKAGLVIAAVSGIMSPMLNIGFVYGQPIFETAKLFGVSERWATLPIWIVVLSGGFLINIGYAIYLLIKNNTFILFTEKIKIPLSVSVISGIFWFSGFGIYGVATSILGPLGVSVGWGLLMSLMIVVSNIWGILMKEWEGSKTALRYQLLSILVLILGIIVIAMGFYV